MRLPSLRGPFSTRVVATLAQGRPAATELAEDACAATDADARLTLRTLSEPAYRGVDSIRTFGDRGVLALLEPTPRPFGR